MCIVLSVIRQSKALGRDSICSCAHRKASYSMEQEVEVRRGTWSHKVARWCRSAKECVEILILRLWDKHAIVTTQRANVMNKSHSCLWSDRIIEQCSSISSKIPYLLCKSPLTLYIACLLPSPQNLLNVSINRTANP
jgi:hypothetical protein